MEHGPKDIRTFFTLVLWELWKHRNAIVFDGASPSVPALATRIVDEGRRWQQAGKLKGSWEASFADVERWARGE